MSYQFYNPAPVLFDLLGIVPLAGGSLQFFEIGTTTPKDTFSDPPLTVPNANPVPLDSAGRTSTRVWLDGDYTVVCRNAAGESVFTRDLVESAGGAGGIPVLAPGFLTNDGTNLLWQEIEQLPDPTGFSNASLRTDGTTVFWSTSAADEVAQQTVEAAASTAINYGLGPVIQLNHGANITTLTFSGLPVTGRAVVLNIVRVKDDSATTRTIAWPASVRWPGGVAPPLTQSANAVDTFSLLTYDGGTTFYGSAAVNVA